MLLITYCNDIKWTVIKVKLFLRALALSKKHKDQSKTINWCQCTLVLCFISNSLIYVKMVALSHMQHKVTKDCWFEYDRWSPRNLLTVNWIFLIYHLKTIDSAFFFSANKGKIYGSKVTPPKNWLLFIKVLETFVRNS